MLSEMGQLALAGTQPRCRPFDLVLLRMPVWSTHVADQPLCLPILPGGNVYRPARTAVLEGP